MQVVVKMGEIVLEDWHWRVVIDWLAQQFVLNKKYNL